MHLAEAAAHGLEAEYRLIDLDVLRVGVEALPRLLAEAEAQGFAGVNITHPCKQAVLPLLDEISDEARALGAVNTVLFRDGRRAGHNTDWWAFRESMREGLPQARLERVAQFGAGGAGAATAYALLTMGAGTLRIVDVEQERAAGLAEAMHRAFGPGRAIVADRSDGACRRRRRRAGHTDRHGVASGHAVRPGAVARRAVAGRSDLFPARNRAAARRAAARVHHPGWDGNGRVAGRPQPSSSSPAGRPTRRECGGRFSRKPKPEAGSRSRKPEPHYATMADAVRAPPAGAAARLFCRVALGLPW